LLSIEYTSPALGTACWALVANELVNRKLIANLYQSGILNWRPVVLFNLSGSWNNCLLPAARWLQMGLSTES
jgi:hypothetical protein